MRIKDSDRQQEVDANGQSGEARTGDFDDLVSLAADICGVPIGLVSIQNEGKHEVRASFGLEDVKIDSLEYFHQFFDLAKEDLVIIPDTKEDQRLNSNSREN